jgi:hypothetical protein
MSTESQDQPGNSDTAVDKADLWAAAKARLEAEVAGVPEGEARAFLAVEWPRFLEWRKVTAERRRFGQLTSLGLPGPAANSLAKLPADVFARLTLDGKPLT